jgi:hypothetical protein
MFWKKHSNWDNVPTVRLNLSKYKKNSIRFSVGLGRSEAHPDGHTANLQYSDPDQQDSITWRISLSGSYSARSAYRIQFT